MTVFKVNNRPVAKSWNGVVNDLFSDFENNFGTAFQSQTPGKAPVNITESENAYNLELAAPGRNKELFTLNVEKNVLTIGYDDDKETEGTGLKTIRNEFSITAFKRSFTLDEKTDAESIEAKYENGILKVTLPKKAEVKPEVKQISIQ
ncbi:Hsp20/alpha crystallin family protein [soil metagenome]